MYCRNCGEKLDDDALFCPRCGKWTSSKMESVEAKVKEISKKVTGYANNTFKDAVPETTQSLLSKIQGVSGILLGCFVIVFGIMTIVLEEEYRLLEGNGLPIVTILFYVLSLTAGLVFAIVSFIIWFNNRRTVEKTESNDLTYVVIGSMDVILAFMAINIARFADVIIKLFNGDYYNIYSAIIGVIKYGDELPTSVKFSTAMVVLLTIAGVISAVLAAYNLRGKSAVGTKE